MPEYIWWIIGALGSLVFVYLLIGLAITGSVWGQLLKLWKELGDL